MRPRRQTLQETTAEMKLGVWSVSEDWQSEFYRHATTKTAVVRNDSADEAWRLVCERRLAE